MDIKKIASFSLLAYINDNNIGVNRFEDIFIPIVKSSLCKMEFDGFESGKSLMEIKKYVDTVFCLDIPIPLLKSLLHTISYDLNTQNETALTLYKDGSFAMKKFTFADYEDELSQRSLEIEEVNNLYKTYLKSNNLSIENQPSIFDYIEQGRLNLSKYFAYKEDQPLEIEFIHQANFINSIKLNKKIYEILRRVYLGSIISAYLEVDIGKTGEKLELLLDTNFIIGILDLNSEESTHTCRKILEICNRLDYTASILPSTIDETIGLIDRKANQLENNFFQGYLDPESIYNAAKRKGLTKTQLQQISGNLKSILETEYNIKIIANDDKYKNLAKYKNPEVLEFYKNIRSSDISAHHDATAIAYVKEKRGTKIISENIFKAKCWFVTNTPYSIALPSNNRALPDIIRADEILNVLWLSNPSVTALVNSSELSVLGLTRLVSNTISYSLPSTKVLKSLDENFIKYGGTEISADDTLMIASMIAKKKILNPEDLNKIANEDSQKFIESVKLYADKGRAEEKEIAKKLVNVLDTFEKLVTHKNYQKANKESVIIVNEANYEREIALLKKRNSRLKKILISIFFIALSTILWGFDYLFSLTVFQTHKNYLLIKIDGQLLLLTIFLAFFTEKYKPQWITVCATLLAALFALIKF